MTYMTDEILLDELKEMDFWKNSGDVIETWLDENEDFIIWLNNDTTDDFDRQLKSALKADDRTVYMEIYVIVSRCEPENDEQAFEVRLSVLFQDKDENTIEENEYVLSPKDNEYMVDALTKTGYIAQMMNEIDNERIENKGRVTEIDNR